MKTFWLVFKTIILMDLCVSQSWLWPFVNEVYLKLVIAFLSHLVEIWWIRVYGIIIDILVIKIAAAFYNYICRFGIPREHEAMKQLWLQNTMVMVNGTAQPQLYLN
jgi:hypothetical protein